MNTRSKTRGRKDRDYANETSKLYLQVAGDTNITFVELNIFAIPLFRLLKRGARVSECETFWTYNWRKGMHFQRRGWHSRNSFHGPSVCGGLKFGPFSQVPQPNRPKSEKMEKLTWPDDHPKFGSSWGAVLAFWGSAQPLRAGTPTSGRCLVLVGRYLKSAPTAKQTNKGTYKQRNKQTKE